MTDLALENLAFGHYMVNKTGANEWDHDELVQESYLGMRRAAKRFDPARGTFTTYTRAWIRQNMGLWRDAMSYPVRLPRSEAAVALRDSLYDAPLDEPITPDGRTLAEVVPSREVDPAVNLDVQLLMARLSPRDRRVIELRYLLDWPVERVAREMGLQPKGVHKAIRRSLARMRE
jgi:RNA polymerase sigma-B factor